MKESGVSTPIEAKKWKDAGISAYSALDWIKWGKMKREGKNPYIVLGGCMEGTYWNKCQIYIGKENYTQKIIKSSVSSNPIFLNSIKKITDMETLHSLFNSKTSFCINSILA